MPRTRPTLLSVVNKVSDRLSVVTHTRTRTSDINASTAAFQETIIGKEKERIMWPILNRVLTSRAGNILVCIPIAIVGYYIEGLVSNRYTPPTAPVTEQREERLLADIDSMSSGRGHSPLEVNLPPSLSV
ncbi:uncharacterized protein LOC143425730 [Xylocopa sonorina]|uniref:uncharacterized protein LOC143425730 n=1 Tax=Xylocopa sonorina TaxID=1818115 RepID=UPI00403B1E0A